MKNNILEINDFCDKSAFISSLISSGLHFKKNGFSIKVFFGKNLELDMSWLKLSLNLNSKLIDLYLEEEKFVLWIKEHLVVNCFEEIPSVFLDIFSNYLIEGFMHLIKDTSHSLKVEQQLERVTDTFNRSLGKHVKFSTFSENNKLDLYVLDNFEELEPLLSQMEPDNNNDKMFEDYNIACAIGLIQLKFSVLKTLCTGDVIFFSSSCNFNKGELILFQDKALMTIKDEEGIFQVKSFFDEIEDINNFADTELNCDQDTEVKLDDEDDFLKTVESDTLIEKNDDENNDQLENKINIGDLQVTLSVEVGYLKTNLSELSNLQVGDIINGNFYNSSELKIKLQGKTVGFGSLVQIESQLGIRLTKLNS